MVDNFVGIMLVAGFLSITWLLSEYDSIRNRDDVDRECCKECRYKNRCRFGG